MPTFVRAILCFVLLSLPALASTPTITSISPNTGPENISPYPVIKGTNFVSGVQVYVNGTIARGVWLGGTTYITFEPPLSAVLGPGQCCNLQTQADLHARTYVYAAKSKRLSMN
jgi:hypothetical protein